MIFCEFVVKDLGVDGASFIAVIAYSTKELLNALANSIVPRVSNYYNLKFNWIASSSLNFESHEISFFYRFFLSMWRQLNLPLYIHVRGLRFCLTATEGREMKKKKKEKNNEKERKRKYFSHVCSKKRREEEKKREKLFCFPLFGL